MNKFADLSLQVAELLPNNEGFLPAETCPQGHYLCNVDGYEPQIGDVCPTCAAKYAYADCEKHGQPAYDHGTGNDTWWYKRGVEEAQANPKPEWRIGRGEPKPYAASLDEITAVERRFAERHPGALLEVRTTSDGKVKAVWRGSNGLYTMTMIAEIEAAARCKALLEAVEIWGWQ